MKSAPPFKAAVVIPTWNEADHISDVLGHLLSQAAALDPALGAISEIVVADGGSLDGTQAIVAEIAAAQPLVRLIDNPARIQSAGMNRAVAGLDAAVDVIIRVDAHSAYPSDFLSGLLQSIADHEAASIVVRLKSVGDGLFQGATGVVSNTIFGTGGAVHRMGMVSGFVDHGHHAAVLRRCYDAIGGYDESFVAAEDAEFDIRLARIGGLIWFDADIVVEYFPRKTARALGRQYFRNGYGRAQTLRKHGSTIRLRLRQLIPPAVLVALVISLVLTLASPWFLLVPAAYLVGCLAVALALAARTGKARVLLAAVALPAMHMSWATGFWWSLLQPRDRRA